MGDEDSEKTQAVIDLNLAALDSADHIEPDTNFPDISLVTTSLLLFFHGLEDYGIEGGDKWHPHAATSRKVNSFPGKASATPEPFIESTTGGSGVKLPEEITKYPRGLTTTSRAYKI
ncbi:hypothetical protein E8E12_010756 [Didymella heteroderae]|uniref:Uncharacterized protein n=1 Tax=Didymella heteroderae TaxID=1769908 RepID=A0A9P5C7G8_9PLEO|nr:hypothetical protein E8E12_010756 [Didymella heteroderae]